MIAVRHAPLAEEGRAIGRSDVTPPGDPAADARRVQALLRIEPRRVHASPLQRCLRLAEPLAAAFGCPLVPDERLVEIDYGAWEGRAWRDIEAADGEALRRWGGAFYEEGPPGGESARALEARVAAWLAEVPDEPCLVVTHAGVIRALWVLGERLDWRRALARPVPHLQPLPIRRPAAG